MRKIIVILVEPQMGENIGAAARIMSNFDIVEMRIVNPRDGWPNAKAIAMAAHGAHILDGAKIYTTTSDAIGDINVLFATSAQTRYMNKPVLTPHEMSESIKSLSHETTIGVLFGRERSGLTNEELLLADSLIRIPVSDKNPSLNLAQAVGLIAYEISKTLELSNPENPQTLATKDEMNFLLQTLDANLSEKNFFKNPQMHPTMSQNINNIFTRANLTSQEVKTLHGIFKALQS